MKKLIVTAVCCFALTACGCEKKREYLDFRELTTFIDSQTESSCESMKPLLSLENYIDIRDRNKFSLVYSVDASCSSCVVDFTHFYISYLNADLTMPVYCVVDDSFKVNIEHWLDQLDIPRGDKLYIVEVPAAFFQIKSGVRYGQIVLLRGSDIIKRGALVDNRLAIV